MLKCLWNGICEKDVGGITGTDLYVCFSVLTPKQRLLVVQIHFPNFEFTPALYSKKRCRYCVLFHIASKITIKRILPLLSVPNYSLTPTMYFISGLTNFPVHVVV
jgi:predicted secreted Zn-dependent protease